MTGEDRQFATLEMLFPASGLAVGCFAVSPDGQTILYSRLVSNGADLMLIENFRWSRQNPIAGPTLNRSASSRARNG